jgi:hypothetical protein
MIMSCFGGDVVDQNGWIQNNPARHTGELVGVNLLPTITLEAVAGVVACIYI